MNQMARNPSDGRLKVFDEGLAAVLAPIGPFLGVGPISLSFEKVDLSRVSADVQIGFQATATRYSTLACGDATTGAAPLLAADVVEGYVAEAVVRRFKSAVSPEALRSEILSGMADKPFHVVCDAVEAYTQEDCNSCDGGVHGCGGCGGHGIQDCANCRTYARRSGMVTCWACHGSGGSTDQGTGNWHNCPTCRGHKQIPCSTCGGRAQVRCGGCGGSGRQSCQSCSGHGFFTRSHNYRVDMACATNPLFENKPEQFKTGALMWLRNGMPSRGLSRDGSEAWSDIDTATAMPMGWDEGVYSVGMRLTIEATSGESVGIYQGSDGRHEVGVGYCRFGRDYFGLTPFLDSAVARRLQAVDAERAVPGKWLSAIADAPGLAETLRGVTGSSASKAVFLERTQRVLNGSVSPKLLEVVADSYGASLGAFEKKGAKTSGIDAVMVVVTAWAVMYALGGFEYIASLAMADRKLAALGLAAAVAFLANIVTRAAMRRRVRKETAGSTDYRTGVLGKIACVAGGVLFVVAGLLLQ